MLEFMLVQGDNVPCPKKPMCLDYSEVHMYQYYSLD
jgi:hypothetical protein